MMEAEIKPDFEISGFDLVQLLTGKNTPEDYYEDDEDIQAVKIIMKHVTAVVVNVEGELSHKYEYSHGDEGEVDNMFHKYAENPAPISIFKKYYPDVNTSNKKYFSIIPVDYNRPGTDEVTIVAFSDDKKYLKHIVGDY